MKNKVAIVLILAASLAAATPVYADTMIHRIGDWFATVGRPQDEKSMILAQRRAERAAKEASQALGQVARDVDRETERAGDKLKNSLNP